jgi:hypothetical protein
MDSRETGLLIKNFFTRRAQSMHQNYGAPDQACGHNSDAFAVSHGNAHSHHGHSHSSAHAANHHGHHVSASSGLLHLQIAILSNPSLRMNSELMVHLRVGSYLPHTAHGHAAKQHHEHAAKAHHDRAAKAHTEHAAKIHHGHKDAGHHSA